MFGLKFDFQLKSTTLDDLENIFTRKNSHIVAQRDYRKVRKLKAFGFLFPSKRNHEQIDTAGGSLAEA